MSPYLKALAKETGKSTRDIEPIWSQAKAITSEIFGKKERDFGNKEYAYAKKTAKSMMGVKEELLDVTKFLNSEHSAKEYIEQLSGAQPSDSFDIGNVSPPDPEEKKKKKKKKDDEGKEACKKKHKKKAKTPVTKEEEYEEEDEELASKF